MKRHLLIILRTCTKVNMINDTGNGRYIKVPKAQLVNVCVSSLVNSINHVQGHDVELIVLDDNSDDHCVADIKNILSHCQFKTSFIPVEGGTGNAYTMNKDFCMVSH